MSDASRPSSRPDFWDVRYARHDRLFGARPSDFVKAEAPRLPADSDVVEVGAGEGRTLVWLARQGHSVTAVDFSEEALATARAWAEQQALSLDTIRADVRTWQPQRRWDVAVVTFVQLLPDERPRLYQLLRSLVRPGGWVLAEWFRPEHLVGEYDRIGPSHADRMVPVEEVRAGFESDEIVRCEAANVHLDTGPHLRGRAAVVRTVVRVGHGENPA